jgi:hypothetical protein
MLRRNVLAMSSAASSYTAGCAATKRDNENKHIRRHFLNEVACWWYAIKELRLREFAKQEYQRRNRGTVKDKPLQANGAATSQQCMIWGQQSEVFQFLTNALSFVNAGFGVLFSVGGVALYFWCGYEYNKLPM